MPSLNFLTIADALALRFAAAAVTPPSGQPPIRKSTARPENNAPPDPFVFVLLDDGTLTVGPVREGEHHFLVRFYHSRKAGDTAEAHMVLLKWLGVLLDQLNAAMLLGLAGAVTKSQTTGYRLAVLTYGGVEYWGLEIPVTVWTKHSATLVAA